MKVKKCLILYNRFNREYEYLKIIKDNLQNIFNIETIILSRYPSFNLLKEGIAFKPDAILIFPLTAKGLSDEIHILKFLFNCKIISLRTEGIINYDNSTSIIEAVGLDSYSKHLVDYEVFWGIKSAKIIGKHLFDSNKITSKWRAIYYGYPKWDIPNIVDDELINLKQFIKNNLFDETLLFVTGFHVSKYDSREKILYAGDIHESNIDNVIYYSKLTTTFKSSLENIINNVSKIKKNTCFIVKIHPLESITDYNFIGKNIKVIHNSQKVNDLLHIADHFFHYGSTSAAEAYKLKKPVYYFYDIPLNEYYTDLKWPSHKKIRINELEDFLIKNKYVNINNSILSQTKKLLKEYFNYTEGDEYRPTFSIAKLISRNFNPQPIGLSNKFLLKSVINLILKILKHPFK
jgi:surface carbohydrate biosynthesis protein